MTDEPNPSAPDSPDTPEAEERLGAVLNGYWEALRRGESTDPKHWLSQHPEGDRGRSDLRLLAALHDACQTVKQDAQLPSPAAAEDGLDTDHELPEPVQLGDYQLIAVLGRGGMGTVYRAIHVRLGKQVAVKVLPLEWANNPRTVARFLREMAAVGRLEHPNLVRAWDAREVNGVHLLAMEYLEGSDLRRLVKQLGPLPVADACEVVRQAAGGLQHAHEKCRLVHRDVKPSNLMLTPQGCVKVLDLGLARVDPEAPGVAASALTSAQVPMGTADYMAPEQWLDSHTADVRADVYSLGCTLYYLLAGRPPFDGPDYDSNNKKMIGHARDPVPPVTRFRPEIPATLAAVLERMLAKRAEDRFATPGQVTAALQPFTAGHDLPALLDPARSGSPVCQAVRRKLLWGVVGAAVLVAASVIVFIAGSLIHRNPTEQPPPPDPPGVQVPPAPIPPAPPPLPRVVEAQSGRALIGGHAKRITCLALSADGKTLATGSYDDIDPVKCWDMGTRKAQATFKGVGPVYGVALSPDGRTLAFGNGTDNLAILCDARTGEELHSLKQHTEPVGCVAFSPDGMTLASGSIDNTLILWNVQTGKLHACLDRRNEVGDVLSLAFAPNGEYLASGHANGHIRIWDLKYGKQPIRVGADTVGRVYGLAVSPDSAILASANENHTDVKLWDVPQLLTGETPQPRLLDHGHGVRCLAFAPDGRTLATLSLPPGRVRLWNPATGEELQLSAPVTGDNSLAFFPNGPTQTLAVAHLNTVRFWNLANLPDTGK